MKKVYLTLASLALAASLAACQEHEGPMEQAGKAADKAVTETQPPLGKDSTAQQGPAEKAGKAVDQAAEKTGNAIGEATEKAGEKMQQMGESIKEKTK